MGKVAYITRCILMDNLPIPSSGSTPRDGRIDVFPTIAAPGDQGISPIGRGGHLPKREDRGNPYQGSPAHWEGYYSSPSQGKGYFELYYFVGDLITLGWKNLLKSNTKGVRTVGRTDRKLATHVLPV
jgi:hypothetical protein